MVDVPVYMVAPEIMERRKNVPTKYLNFIRYSIIKFSDSPVLSNVTSPMLSL